MYTKLQKNEDVAEVLKSSDIGLVSFLLCSGFQLLELERTGGSRVIFVIKREKNIESAVESYWDFKGYCDAQSYFNQLKRLKNQIYNPD